MQHHVADNSAMEQFSSPRVYHCGFFRHFLAPRARCQLVYVYDSYMAYGNFTSQYSYDVCVCVSITKQAKSDISYSKLAGRI